MIPYGYGQWDNKGYGGLFYIGFRVANGKGELTMAVRKTTQLSQF